MKFIRPTLVTITAPTCSGKSYLLERLTSTEPRRIAMFSRIVSTTTRPPRRGEVEGVDYNFISVETSKLMEDEGKFAELITFRGTRYGVTKEEMDKKINSDLSPIVILEPQGLKIYEQLCRENGWDIFKVFVSTPEPLRIERLNQRTVHDTITACLDRFMFTQENGEVSVAAAELSSVKKVIATHTDRLLSITGDERNWQCSNTWDAVIPGDDVEKAIQMLKEGISWRNKQRARVTD